MNSQSTAILAMQWKILLNFYRRHGQMGFIFSMLVSLLWYSGFIVLAGFASSWLATVDLQGRAEFILGIGYFGAFIYWQGMPLAMASMGGLLDIRKLSAFPIPSGTLYRLELLLRVFLFPEMPILMIGCMIGLLQNSGSPKWAVFSPLLFALFNIFLGAGVKDLILRLMNRKGLREFFVLAIVLLITLPSFIARKGSMIPEEVSRLFSWIPVVILPWGAATEATLHPQSMLPWALLIAMTGVAWLFSRWQFNRNLDFDSDSAKGGVKRKEAPSRFDFLFTWPDRIFPDPLAVLVQKEIRFLSRVSRFRTVFMMGFSFGLLIWLPMMMGNSRNWTSQNFLVMVSGYALLLLSGVCFYNIFGFDRGATQFYFVTPVARTTILIAKNITTVFFVILEVLIIVLVCILFRMPLTPEKVLEAACACAVMTLFLLGLGNIISVQSARAVNPNDNWKNNSGKAAWVTLFAYPLFAAPVGLAYLARWAFQTNTAFYSVIVAGLFLAASFYWVSLSTATELMEKNQEEMLTLLSQTDSPSI